MKFLIWSQGQILCFLRPCFFLQLHHALMFSNEIIYRALELLFTQFFNITQTPLRFLLLQTCVESPQLSPVIRHQTPLITLRLNSPVTLFLRNLVISSSCHGRATRCCCGLSNCHDRFEFLRDSFLKNQRRISNFWFAKVLLCLQPRLYAISNRIMLLFLRQRLYRILCGYFKALVIGVGSN